MRIILAIEMLLVSGLCLISHNSISGSKTIDCGPGSDALTKSYGSISSLNDFSIDRSGDYTSSTDDVGNTVLFKNIATLTVGGRDYVGIYDGVASSGSAALNTSGNYSDPESWISRGQLRI